MPPPLIDCTSVGPGSWRLSFVNTWFGDSVVDWTPNYKRQTEINQHQSFRAPYVILDGRYPAPVIQHSFDIYIERETLREYHRNYFSLFATFINTDPSPLNLYETGTGSLYASFGRCYLMPPEFKEPESILHHRAGILRCQFMGTVLATIYSY